MNNLKVILKRRTIGKLRRVDSDEESLFGEEKKPFLRFPCFCCDIKKGIKLGEDNLDGSFLSRSKNSPFR